MLHHCQQLLRNYMCLAIHISRRKNIWRWYQQNRTEVSTTTVFTWRKYFRKNWLWCRSANGLHWLDPTEFMIESVESCKNNEPTKGHLQNHCFESQARCQTQQESFWRHDMEVEGCKTSNFRCAGLKTDMANFYTKLCCNHFNKNSWHADHAYSFAKMIILAKNFSSKNVLIA